LGSAAGALAIGQVPERLRVPDGAGVNVHFTDDAQPGEFEMLVASGVKWIRADMDWSACERKRGTYEWRRWERLLDRCDRKGDERKVAAWTVGTGRTVEVEGAKVGLDNTPRYVGVRQ
jgi:hypothetical protein